MTNKLKHKTSFIKHIFKTKNKMLFYNHIKEVEYQKISFVTKYPFDEEDTLEERDAWRVKISPEEVLNIKGYVRILQYVKEESSKLMNDPVSYESRSQSYSEGFIGEYACAKLFLAFGLKPKWDNRFCGHKQGDKGDLTIKSSFINIKCKDYKCEDRELHHDISSLKYSDYFVLSHIKEQDDGSVFVDVLGFYTKDDIEQIPQTRNHIKNYSYLARRASYKNSRPIEDFFKLTF